MAKLMATQAEKGAAFRALHQRDRAFLIPNPWDIGTGRLLQMLGFEALATTSGGFAFSIGKPDGAVDRETMLAHAAALVAATDLPVSADLEAGYADEPKRVAETVRRAAAVKNGAVRHLMQQHRQAGDDAELISVALAKRI